MWVVSRCKACLLAKEKEYYANNKDVLNAKCKAYHHAHREFRIRQMGEYKKQRCVVDHNYRLHLNFRNLNRKFFTSDSRNVADHRLVLKITLEWWINFQRMLNDAPDNFHLDERWPNSKFDLEDPYHCLIATNIFN